MILMKRSLACVVLAACTEHGQTPTQSAIVAPLREPCQGFAPSMCLVMVPDQQPRERLFAGIVGYTHRWGVESEITFRREALDPPPLDGPSERVILLEVLDENDAIAAPFTLTFPAGGPGWFSGSAPALDMLGTTVQCDTDLCTQLDVADTAGQPFEVVMELVDAQTLRATSVTL